MVFWAAKTWSILQGHQHFGKARASNLQCGFPL